MSYQDTILKAITISKQKKKTHTNAQYIVVQLLKSRVSL